MSEQLPILPLAIVRQVDIACNRFEAECQAGQVPRIEDYLAEIPEAGRGALLREMLRLERDYRCAEVGPTAHRDYVARLAPLGDWVVPILAELLPPAQGFSVTLTVTAGPHTGRTYIFDRHDTFVVGRASDAHFSLPDDLFFSRSHFMIEVNPPLCKLVDLHSKNGVLVNGERVEEADLMDNDEIRGGKSALRVSITRPALAATLTDVPRDWSPPTVDRPCVMPAVPGYRLLRELGQGGMGVVYLAERDGENDAVAIKLIKPAIAPNATALARFIREADILRQLSHPHVVSFKDMGETAGLLYFAMEYVAGTDAGVLVRTQGPMPVKRAVNLMSQVLNALAHSHARGFVHRDVKPSNILVASGPGGNEIAKLADFGLARTYQASQLSGLTMSKRAGGTPGFMPPEQILDFRSVRPAADQYAAAATLYYLLSGEYPFGTCKGVDELFQKVLDSEPVPLSQRRPGIPADLAAAVMRGLARKAEKRFADAASFAAAISTFK